MAIFVNSWPAGIAAALLLLPVTAQVGGLALGWWMVSGFILSGLIAFFTLFQPLEDVEATAGLRFIILPLYPLFARRMDNLLKARIWELTGGIGMRLAIAPIPAMILRCWGISFNP
ncbi:hypothetical protein [Roseibium sp. SCP14]|uniref:hypothetical protein n=1 Tax=Roseibium sp. SCP14 TaxID=3141375 RepID=UPI00333A23F8